MGWVGEWEPFGHASDGCEIPRTCTRNHQTLLAVVSGGRPPSGHEPFQQTGQAAARQPASTGKLSSSGYALADTISIDLIKSLPRFQVQSPSL
jgi:hypothetical protein